MKIQLLKDDLPRLSTATVMDLRKKGQEVRRAPLVPGCNLR